MIRNLPSLFDDLYRTHTHAQTSARNAHAPSHSPCFTCSLSLSVTRMPTPERNSSSSLTLWPCLTHTHTRTFVLAQAHALAIKSLHVVQRERPDRCSRQRFARSSFFRCCSFGLEKKKLGSFAFFHSLVFSVSWLSISFHKILPETFQERASCSTRDEPRPTKRTRTQAAGMRGDLAVHHSNKISSIFLLPFMNLMITIDKLIIPKYFAASGSRTQDVPINVWLICLMSSNIFSSFTFMFSSMPVLS